MLWRTWRRGLDEAPEEDLLRAKALRVLARHRWDLSRVDFDQGPCGDCYGSGYQLERFCLADDLGKSFLAELLDRQGSKASAPRQAGSDR